MTDQTAEFFAVQGDDQPFAEVRHAPSQTVLATVPNTNGDALPRARELAAFFLTKEEVRSVMSEAAARAAEAGDEAFVRKIDDLMKRMVG